jgi:hypothetical protein
MVHQQRKALGFWFTVWSLAVLSAAVLCVG